LSFQLELKGSLAKDGGFKPGGTYIKDSLCKTLILLIGEEMMRNILTAAGVEFCPFSAVSNLLCL
jgi:hypothetical protein